MVRSLLTVLSIVWLAAPSFGQGAASIKIAIEHRVANTDPSGICWYCCAATIGRHANIPALKDIHEKVLKTGIGHKTGATGESVDYWMKELDLAPYVNPVGKKDAESRELLHSWLDKRFPVIVSYSHPTGQHAIILTRLGRVREKWKAQDGTEYEDFTISYIDVNEPDKTWKSTWGWFSGVWTGRAMAFDPALPNHMPKIRPVRLMAASGAFQPGRKALPPEIVSRTPWRPLESEVPRQAPVVVPQQLPFHASLAVDRAKEVKVSSNQDIKDGVTRPKDLISGAGVGYGGHDYHSEYEAYKAAREAR